MAEGVVQRAVDARQAHTEARGLVAVDLQVGLQALVLQVAGHIGKLGQLLQALQQFWRPDAQGVHIRVLQAELVLGAGDPVFQAKVLHRLQIQATAGQLSNLRLQATDHLLGRNIAFFMGLEVDQQPPGVERRVAAIHANKRRQAGHRRVAQHQVGQLLLALGHGGEGDRLRALADALNHPGVLLGEQALGHQHVQQHGEGQGGHGHPQGQGLMAQHHLQGTGIAGDHGVDKLPGATGKPALLGFRLMTQQLGAEHRRQGQGHHCRNQDGDRQGDGEFAEQPPRDIAHE